MNSTVDVADLRIIHYPHPTLRHKSKPLRKVDKAIKSHIETMFELMYAAKGIGLAANQVDLPFQMFVINPDGDQKTGNEQVFINPVIKSSKGQASAEEGCLSLPGVYGQVSRPEQIVVTGYDLSGNEINLSATGLLARVIQHEFDHLHGTLFIDRLDASEIKRIEEQIDEFEIELKRLQESRAIPSNEEVAQRLAALERQYC
ncbi:MAG: peptide deformylase [Pirellulaceae bacterium]